MYGGKVLFAQTLDYKPWKTLHRIVMRYDAEHGDRTLPIADQHLIITFGQLANVVSL